MEYVTPKQAKQIFKVTDKTLRRWEKKGKITSTRTEGGHRRYKIHRGKINKNKRGKQIIYARVSSGKQKEDLERQINYLKRAFPKHILVTDIGSGINFNRKGFKAILEELFTYNIEEVVVTSQDRFARFGFDFFEFLFKKFDSKIHVINEKQIKTAEQELSEDIISIITVFTARYHGRRKYNIHTKN